MNDTEEKVDANRDIALELRLHRQWKDDINAAYRSQLQDILSHLESRLPTLVADIVGPIVTKAQQDTRDKLAEHDARVEKSIADSKAELEKTITLIVLNVLKQYQIVDANINLHPGAVAYAISRQ